MIFSGRRKAHEYQALDYRRYFFVNRRMNAAQRPPVTILVSHEYTKGASAARKMDWFLSEAEAGRVELLLDSGAFTAFTRGKRKPLAPYLAYVREHEKLLWGYFQLDVIDDPAESERNLQTMLDAGLRPIPVHAKADSRERMEGLYSVSDTVALGGLVAAAGGKATRGNIERRTRWAGKRKLHWLGYTSVPMLTKFRPASCDSSGCCAGSIYGRASFYEGAGVMVTIPRSEKASAVMTPQMSRLLKSVGFGRDEFYDDSYWAMKVSGRPIWQIIPTVVTPLSWLMMSADIRVRLGSRLFLVNTLSPDHDSLRLAIEAYHAS